MTLATVDPMFISAVYHGVRKGLETDEARSELRPGVYRDLTVDLSVRVGEMRVAPDTDRAPTSSIPLLPTLALFVKRMGLQREEALKTLREVMAEALELKGSPPAEAKLLEESGVAEAMQRIKEDVISKLPRLPTKGAVTVDGVEVRVLQMRTG